MASLNLGYKHLTEDELLISINQIKRKLLTIFKDHIGKDNAINAYNLFEQTMGMRPESMNVFKRYFWYNVIKVAMRELRHEEKIFVVSNYSAEFYVLNSRAELKEFEQKIDRIITGLIRTKKKARKWVEKL